MNILLVEPDYKNKYPPMGLMKISTYHKNRGDNVLFFKGIMKKRLFDADSFDRVYITSLFTFHYDLTVKTIWEYQKLVSPSKIYVGGIMATLMESKLRNDIGEETKILTGLLNDSKDIEFDDNENIDRLPLDYSILDDISFKYSAGDNYFAYISRGCTNKCKFCAVPILEPEFCMTNNIINQVNTIKKQFGEKQNLLLLDNNILSFDVESLQQIVNDIKSLGFDKSTKYYPELPLLNYIKKLERLDISSIARNNILSELIAYLHEKMTVKKSKNYQDKFLQLITSLDEAEDKYAYIIDNLAVFTEILRFYHRPTGRRRTVDFNQGIDARQLSDEKMAVLAQIPIEPFRLAFDGIAYEKVYTEAVKTATHHGVGSFSNYLLYNFEDKPEDLWLRLKLNIELAKECHIKIFSFPMKYAPIDRTDRIYIGRHWNRVFLSNIYAILNVTKGIVAEGSAFFEKAFGKDIDEYFEILSMPREFVMYRSFFESNGLSFEWKTRYNALDIQERHDLINIVSTGQRTENQAINDILPYYKIKRKDVEDK